MSLIFSKHEWLEACKRLLPELSDEQREAFWEDVEEQDLEYRRTRFALKEEAV